MELPNNSPSFRQSLQLTPRVREFSSRLPSPHESPRCVFVQVERHQHPPEPDESPYDLPVDPKQFDRATTIKPTSMLRPHMRIFYLSWMSAITGFFGWYAIPPLMPVIKTHLGLTDGEVLNSDIASTASTIISRIASGPLLDRYGSQAVQSTGLWFGAIPIVCAAFVNSATSLLIVRFFIELVGCVFVTSQYWTTITFARNVASAANAITGGMGLSGIGWALLLFPFAFKAITSGGYVSEDLGWRITIALPAVLMITAGVVIRFAVDGCPTGDFQELVEKKQRAEQSTINLDGSVDVETTAQTKKLNCPSLFQSFKIVLPDPNVLIMIAHYGASFGTELQLNNMGALYFYNEFTKKGLCRQYVLLPVDQDQRGVSGVVVWTYEHGRSCYRRLNVGRSESPTGNARPSVRAVHLALHSRSSCACT